VILLLLLVNIAFTTTARRPSYWLLVGMMVSLLLGDLAYAIIGLFREPLGLADPGPPVPARLHDDRRGRAASVGGVPRPGHAHAGAGLVLAPAAADLPALATPFGLTALLHDPTRSNGWSRRSRAP